jgi:hypothetical protein
VQGTFANCNRERTTNYGLGLVEILVFSWDIGDTESEGEYKFLYGKRNDNYELVQNFCTREKHIRR